MKILFRADAKPEVGTGDLISLANLACEFREKGWEIHFATQKTETSEKILKQKASPKDIISFLARNKSLNDEISFLNEYIGKNGIDVVFLEITEHHYRYYCRLDAAKIKACVDFFGTIDETFDFVVNWEVDSEKLYPPKQFPKTQFLLGPENVILPPEFLKNKPAGRKRDNPPKKILVTMGGSDDLDYTGKVIRILSNLGKNINITILLGPGYKYRKKLEDFISEYPQFTIKQNITNVLEEYFECDLAISAGGLTAFELIAAETPSVLIAGCEHQIKRCRYFDKQKWAVYLGQGENFDQKKLVAALSSPPPAPPKMEFGGNAGIERIIYTKL